MELSKKQLEKILLQFRKQAAIEPSPNCPDDEMLACYLDGILNADEREKILKHLHSCSYCRHTVIAASVDFKQNASEDNSTKNSATIFESELDAMEKELGLDQPPKKPVRPPIMLIDDDPIYLKSLFHTLSDEFIVTACKDGFEALDRINDEIKAVVLDIKMARMNGLEVAEKLKTRHESIPVIFNTGYPGEYVRQDIEKRYRPFGYVTKDEPSQLYAFVRWAASGTCCLPA